MRGVMDVEIERFSWGSFNHDPPKYMRVKRANDQFLVLERTRDDYKENYILAKIGANRFAVFRINVTLGESYQLNTDKIVCAGTLIHVLRMVGYNVGVDTIRH